MTEDLLKSKIELLEAQILNFEKSGFFTEKEIDRLSAPLRLELEILNKLELNISLKKVWDSAGRNKKVTSDLPESKFIIITTQPINKI